LVSGNLVLLKEVLYLVHQEEAYTGGFV